VAMGPKFYVFFDHDDGLAFESSCVELVSNLVHRDFLLIAYVVFLPRLEGFELETIGVAELALHSLVAVSD
jgi:hypothetical protein